MKIAPSILAADFANLGREVRSVEAGGADYIHIDVMDGHFVPNITMGPPTVKALRPITALPLDVHLMIANPDEFIQGFAEAGADIISVHVEACPHLHRTIQLIKNAGLKAGVVLNPATPLQHIEHVLADVDMVLIMTVNPGFGGQSFIPAMLDKIADLAKISKEKQLNIDIEVDGGVNQETAKQCVAHGANILVAGSAIFKQKDRETFIQTLHHV